VRRVTRLRNDVAAPALHGRPIPLGGSDVRDITGALRVLMLRR